MMKKFRKKPVVIEAEQLTYKNIEYLAGLVGGKVLRAGNTYLGDDYVVLQIPTLEGVMAGEIGDWIIRGVKGEFYPCKPDIFAETYEVADV